MHKARLALKHQSIVCRVTVDHFEFVVHLQARVCYGHIGRSLSYMQICVAHFVATMRIEQFARHITRYLVWTVVLMLRSFHVLKKK